MALSFNQGFSADAGRKLRCVKIMAAEHTFKLLLTELKKRKRGDDGTPGEVGDESTPSKAKSKASQRRPKSKANGEK